MTIEEIIEVNNIGRYYYLKDFNAYVFPKEEVIKIIQFLKEEFYPILGGDVFLQENGCFSIAYDFWRCNQEKNENPYDFLNRSCDMAMTFVLERAAHDEYLYEVCFKQWMFNVCSFHLF